MGGGWWCCGGGAGRGASLVPLLDRSMPKEPAKNHSSSKSTTDVTLEILYQLKWSFSTLNIENTHILSRKY